MKEHKGVLKMFTNEYKIKPSILFEGGEVFLAVASLLSTDNKIGWLIPECLKNFIDYANQNPIKNFLDENELLMYKDWFVQHLDINKDSLSIIISKEYKSDEIIKDTFGEKIKYNQEDKADRISDNTFREYYLGKKQKVVGYVDKNKFTALAGDNGNGAVSLLYKKEGDYLKNTTECLRRLISEYQKNGTPLYLATPKTNEDEKEIARRSGMAFSGYLYWVKIDNVNEIKNEELKKRIFV